MKIDIKNMSPEERRQYYREKRQNSRSRRSHTVYDSDIHFETEQLEDLETQGEHENVQEEPESLAAESESVLRLINSPSKKRNMPRQNCERN